MARNYSSVVEPKTLTANVGTSDVQITLNNVTGLPSAPYVLVLNPDTVKEEAVLVTVDQTGVTSPTLKVERAIEARSGLGTAQTHSVGNIVKHMIVGSDMQIVHDHFSDDNTTSGTAHGATGGVVGRTNSQTLTNKTVNLADNTLTGTKAQFNAALSDADFATIGGTETLTAKTLTTPTITSPVITGGTINGGAALTVDSTELNKLDGVTATTAQINGLDTLTASRAIVTAGSGTLTAAVTTSTEIARLSGLSSNVQDQLNTLSSEKLNKTGGTVTGILNVATEGDLRVAGDVVRASVGGVGSAASSGTTSVSHGLGTTPSSVVVGMRTAGTTTGSPRIFYVTAVDSNSFDVRALDTAGNQQSGAFYWIAIA
jgi:hypothetical protein